MMPGRASQIYLPAGLQLSPRALTNDRMTLSLAELPCAARVVELWLRLRDESVESLAAHWLPAVAEKMA